MLEGTFKIFSSAHNEIKLEALLASAAIPNLFPAVWVDGHAYWDGIFSSNPPVVAFLRKPTWASTLARGDLDHPGQSRRGRFGPRDCRVTSSIAATIWPAT